jgi:hypothetical protein
MKKVFTLLFCIVALSATASTNELIDQCVNALLNAQSPARIMAANPSLDANSDGLISIADVTTLIDLSLEESQVNRAPAQKTDIDALARKITMSPTHEPNISDLNDAIESNLKEE